MLMPLALCADWGAVSGGPTAAPTSPDLSYVNGGPGPDEIRISWTNGDVTAQTEIAATDSVGGEPGVVLQTVAAAGTSWDTSITGWIGTYPEAKEICVRHIKNGVRTAWVRSALKYVTEFPT